MATDQTFRFECAACGATSAVDAGVRETVLEAGCPVCGHPVDPSAFERT